VQLIAGTDAFGNFTIKPPPTERLTSTDFADVAADMATRERVLYEGADKSGGFS
jgi:hypothetical protein